MQPAHKIRSRSSIYPEKKLRALVTFRPRPSSSTSNKKRRSERLFIHSLMKRCAEFHYPSDPYS